MLLSLISYYGYSYIQFHFRIQNWHPSPNYCINQSTSTFYLYEYLEFDSLNLWHFTNVGFIVYTVLKIKIAYKIIKISLLIIKILYHRNTYKESG